MPVDGLEFRRAADVVWRLAPDRVLLRRVVDEADVDAGDATADLMGAAALVWVALDEPAPRVQIVERLSESGIEPAGDDVAGALDQLIAAGWVLVRETLVS